MYRPIQSHNVAVKQPSISGRSRRCKLTYEAQIRNTKDAYIPHTYRREVSFISLSKQFIKHTHTAIHRFYNMIQKKMAPAEDPLQAYTLGLHW